ncbi:hypothetical protein DOTSEDRAFT_67549 [Dothistroma septosporum NZE10]|uniref:ML-like domain-containing protein n=1 Tax=Dothistroma septosporum (strain NZE10 / CBS 128990) TaxID=675120 RepID=N1PYM7_DOTSN|nr:hypothetical protein DOTSEDRAFT_67549 [Dothistroma septosporum NZE10]
MTPRIRAGLVAALLVLLSSLQLALAVSNGSNTRWITYQTGDGETLYLDDNRRPSLYTDKFGDCMGDSQINVTRFDAAYYKDNMTVLFHLAGNTGISNDSLMMYIGVYAYGEDRFDLVFNPCNANIYSMCPVNSSVPITASGIIPVSESDVANIPPIALSIPDFEGEAILRIFSNTTRSEIACYSAVVTNGNSFGQPKSVGSVLGIFTFVALIASFATAIYGEAVPTMRLHYAHSLSVGVVFAVWQHIFFTGALSVNWPSVLVAWWTNFAWAGGMIYTSSMQRSIDSLIGTNIGNTSQVGAAQSGADNSNVGGGYDISLIYKRMMGSGIERAFSAASRHPLIRNIASEIYGRDYSIVLSRDVLQKTVERTLHARDNTIADASDGYKWYGQPVHNGLPLPGNYSGFAGTLAEEGIAVSNAFMTGFLWFLILLVLMVASVAGFKWMLECLTRLKWIREDKLKYFRNHWLGLAGIVALRTWFIGWFILMFLTIFQFTYDSSGGVKGIAAIVFIICFLGMPAIAAYAVWYKWCIADNEADRANGFERNKLLGGKFPVPWFGKKQPQTNVEEQGVRRKDGENGTSNVPFWKRMTSGGAVNSKRSIHDDEDYTKKFGWLASRFRRTRWWFFTFWLFYEFIRAIFYAGASGYAKAQVFGLLVVEILAFAFILWVRPFEGQRLNIIVVYCLGFSKVASVALSAAFDVEFNLQRITTTVIGIVIIVIQGFLTIITMIAIVVGAISSYMSVSRNQEDFRPRKWHSLREKYFDHLDRTVNDLPRPPKPVKEKKKKLEPEPEPEPGFEMKNVRRLHKIEDEDKQFASEIREPNASFLDKDPFPGRGGSGTPARSRANSSRAPSVHSMHSLPFGARPHRASWSTRDFAQNTSAIDMSRTTEEDEAISRPTTGGKAPMRSMTDPSLFRLSYQPSVTSLNLGGEVSTFDTIGNVPMPTVRPRAGTHSSRGAARSVTSQYGMIPEGQRSTDFLNAELPDSQPGSKRTSMIGSSSAAGRSQPMMTPAQEADEWELTKTTSRQ